MKEVTVSVARRKPVAAKGKRHRVVAEGTHDGGFHSEISEMPEKYDGNPPPAPMTASHPNKKALLRHLKDNLPEMPGAPPDDEAAEGEA